MINEQHNQWCKDLKELHRKTEALEHIIEYWNKDENLAAMSDALWHILETAENAL